MHVANDISEDWDDDADGEWEPNMIDNPKYKGVWKPTRIDNPNYKGQWVAPEIDNPDFIDDPNVYVQKDLQFVGFELWQVCKCTHCKVLGC